MNIFILFLAGLSIFFEQKTLNTSQDFFRLFVKKDIIKLVLTEKIRYEINSVRIFQDNTILVVDKKEELIHRFDSDGRLLSRLILKIKLPHLEDVIADSSGMFYAIDGYGNIIQKFDQNGEVKKIIRVKNGNMLCLVNDNQLLVYNTFHPKGVQKEQIIHCYTLDGNFIHSFGREPKKPKIGMLPIATGCISSCDQNIIVGHGSDYIVDIYNLNGVLIKTYNKRPSFYTPLISFKSLDKKEIKKWNGTTQLFGSYMLVKDLLVSHFMSVDGTRQWLFMQNDKRSLEISLPTSLLPIGVNDNKIFFIDIKGTENNEKTLIIYGYEFQSHLFK